MANVTASAVSSLRARTGVSVLACKKALEESSGDEEKAIEILRKQGMAQAAKKAGRAQSQGIVFHAQSAGKAALVLVLCETDFVARDPYFLSSGKELAQVLLRDGKDAFLKRAGELIPAMVQKFGENISLGEHAAAEAPVLGVYVHTNGKIGDAEGLDSGTEELARDAAMHAAAMKPLYVAPEDVPESAVASERDIWRAQLASEKKPDAIIEKIMLGKEKKFREENALITQEFVKDPGKRVKDHLGKAKVTAYARLAV
jgi:elongation factor Ts